LQFKKGDRVKHPKKPEWGLGEVLGDSSGEKVHVFFTEAREVTLSLKHVSLILVTGEAARHPGLDRPRVSARKKRKEYKNLELLKDKFLAQFPGGFLGSKYAEGERNYKDAAHQAMIQSLNQSSYAELLSSGEHSEICKRALYVANKTNLIFPNEKMKLKDGLESPEHQREFAEKLFNLLYDKERLEECFNEFADCLMKMGADKWTVATYHLFIARPDTHMFLKPTVTQDAADVCAFELNYRPDLNWLTYKRLLEFSNHLLDQLADLRPKDMIDVQSFIWCIAQD
jgi:hypothetical protein